MNPSERNYKVLDMMMRHLRFVKTHDREVRIQLYRHAQFVEYPSHTEICKRGDEVDYMYIILKGRVSQLSVHVQYPDIPYLKGSAKDGETFGDDVTAVERDPNLDKDGSSQEAAKPRRLTTCTTVEASRMMRILASDAKRILQ